MNTLKQIIVHAPPELREALHDLTDHGLLTRCAGLRPGPIDTPTATMSDHDQPVAANVLAQDFVADTPNHRWVGDTTEFVIGRSGKLYLAAILDLYSRFLVGWAVSAINDRHLVIKALQMALQRRTPAAGLLHHSDQGSPYASDDYQRIITRHRMTGSMSRRGNCDDCDGKLVLDGEARARRTLRQLRRGQDGALRLHRGVLQPAATTLDARPDQPG